MPDYKDTQMYKDLVEMVRIPSVSPSSEENRVADYIHSQLSSISWFRDNPGDLMLLPCKGDPLERNMVFAIVRATATTSKTILLTGHMDVVTTDMYGSLKDQAFEPEEFTERILEVEMSSGARADLESGDWLFGRGVADMKSGLAACMDQLRKAAQNTSLLKTNVAVLFVPDEENNSMGMVSAVPYLKGLTAEGLEFVACIDTEPPFPVEGRSVPTAYLGTVGKANTFFYFEGIGTHVGEYYNGMSAGLISSCLNLELDGNPDLADRCGDFYSSPFGCIKIRDMRDEYSASIVNSGSQIYSYLTVSLSPSEILDNLKNIASQSLSKAADIFRKRRKKYSDLSKIQFEPADLDLKVLSYGELEKKASQIDPEFLETLAEKILFDENSGDERDRAVRFTAELTKKCEIDPPFIIYGFLPPWYPHRANGRETDGDRMIALVIKDLADHAAKNFEINVAKKEFFDGICDLSYCGYRGNKEEIKKIGENMPGWNRFYSLPLEDLSELDIPVLNFGPLGKDLHKKTERVNIPFLFDVYPYLLSHVIQIIQDKVR
jgi:arginine utilization protein RocB